MKSHHRRTVSGIALLGAAVLAAIVLASGAHSAPDRASWPEYRNRAAAVGARIPGSWQIISRPITGVTYPPQVLAAASYPARAPRSPNGCTPTKVLSQMPRSGALVQVFEYAPESPTGKPIKVPKLPPKPANLSYSDASYGRFECAGPSYKFVFSLAGRAFQAHVWLSRRFVSPAARAQALGILASFHVLPDD
jgi:hypothetical protein